MEGMTFTFMKNQPEFLSSPELTDHGNAGASAGAGLQSCCVHAAKLHARHNQMIACSECKQVLKFFREVTPLRNYLKFCESNRRPVSVGKVDGYFVVAFSF
jgi:hypothetical protein